jgi:hypothetical protein
MVFSTRDPYVLNTDLQNACLPVLGDMPQCNDLAELRKMDRCSALTPHQAALYGGVPSLIFSSIDDPGLAYVKFNVALSGFPMTHPHFDGLPELERLEYLRLFVEALFDGNSTRIRGPLTYFDQFSSMPKPGKMRWVPCYFTQILKVFSVPTMVWHLIKDIDNIVRREVSTFTSSVQTELDWKCVVNLAVSLKALQALLRRTNHPLVPDVIVKKVQCLPMPLEYETLKDGQQFINHHVARSSPGDLMIFRSNFEKFPLFDGFVVGIRNDGGSAVSGYQLKLGRNTPSKDVPQWVNRGGHLVRGLTSGSSSTLPSSWKYYSEEEIKEFVGYSLLPLYPASWTSADERFD